MAAAELVAADDSVLVFRSAGEMFALPAHRVGEVLRDGAVTRVPNAPASLLGLTNLRGAVLPVISVAALLGQPETTGAAARRIVVAHADASEGAQGGSRVGLRVDEVVSLGRGGAGRVLELDALLEREFAGLARPAAARLTQAAPRAEAVAASETRLLLGLRAGGQAYALPLEQVVEVLALPPDRSIVAGNDKVVLGAIPFRRGSLPLVSLPALLGLGPAPLERARIVVVRIGGTAVGLVTDALEAVLRVRDDSIDSVPVVLDRGAAEARLDGIVRLDGGKRLAGILATHRLFDAATQARLDAQAGTGDTMSTAGTEHDTGEERFLLFRLGDEHYGLPIETVREVVRRPPALTPLPRAPAFVAGMLNLRGRPVPVIEQRLRFAAGGADGGANRIVVVGLGPMLVGFAVDAVLDIASFPPSALEPAPDVGAATFDRVAVAQDGRMILLIDPKALLDQAERDLLAELAT